MRIVVFRIGCHQPHRIAIIDASEVLALRNQIYFLHHLIIDRAITNSVAYLHHLSIISIWTIINAFF